MNFIKGALCLTLTGLLSACGGGSDGYYNNNAGSSSGGGSVTTPTTPGNLTQAKTTLDALKKEGQYLFGNYDPNDVSTAKGYIDHAMDTFTQGPLQLSVDVKKLFDQDKSYFTYYPKCFGGEGNKIYENTPCYALEGEQNIKAALNKIAPNVYSNWDFNITKDQLAKLKITPEQIEKFTGESFLLLFDNQNNDKAFNDVWVAGVFGYPYQQSWGLSQTGQIRIVSMNGEGQYNVTVTNNIINDLGQSEEVKKTYGALSIYKDPTSTDGDLFVFQNNSSFDVLINDNPNTPDLEPISFTINSVPGNKDALATYRIRPSSVKVLSIPSLTAISGSRVENESPSTNTKSFTGSIYLEGQNIFTFKKSLNGTTLNFKHVFDGITFEGQSTNNNGTVTTKLSQPSGLTY